MEKTVPTLEEFIELVKKEYLDDDWVVSTADKMRYFESEEAQEVIKSMYDSAVEKYNDGELSETQFRIGRVSSTAYNLYMMWELV